MARYDRSTLTIANGAAVSQGYSIPPGVNSVALVLPAAWTAADLSFETSIDGGTTWAAVWDDASAEVKVASATMTARVGDALVDAGILRKLAALPMIRLRSGVEGANVNQGAERVFTVFAKFI